jgi:hypothetical protein
VPEFGATEHIRRYPAGDAEALVQLVTACYEDKRARSNLVADRSWDHWAEAHHHVFTRLLRERGWALPPPAPAFRFGLLRELDIPWGMDVRGLETLVDWTAAQLYHGRYRTARLILKEAVSRYPLARKLLKLIPEEDRVSTPRPSVSITARAPAPAEFGREES